MTATKASSGEDRPEESAPTAEALEDSDEYLMRLRDRRRRCRRRWIDAGIEGSPTMTSELVEEDRDENGGVFRG